MNQSQSDSWRKRAETIARAMNQRGRDVEDAAQEAVIACWRCVEKHGPMSKSLERDVIRKAIMAYIRGDEAQTRRNVYLAEVSYVHPNVAVEDSEDELIHGTHTAAHVPYDEDFSSVFVNDYIDSLEPRDRFIVLCRMDNMTLDEIAEALPSAGFEKVTKQRIDQILEKLAESFDK